MSETSICFRYRYHIFLSIFLCDRLVTWKKEIWREENETETSILYDKT